MERDPRPKRYARAFGLLAAGAPVVERDLRGEPWDPFSDVVFLVNHPGWTWRDLQETPDDVIADMRAADAAGRK